MIFRYVAYYMMTDVQVPRIDERQIRSISRLPHGRLKLVKTICIDEIFIHVLFVNRCLDNFPIKTFFWELIDLCRINIKEDIWNNIRFGWKFTPNLLCTDLLQAGGHILSFQYRINPFLHLFQQQEACPFRTQNMGTRNFLRCGFCD
ncbi:hypothetical protein O6H91_17G043700 [Diphasiastrum complanatum]|uniref:Uncharacterized protein n=1 Tax=Diphasiastrum complanatum TaxID=34168 RepID=A0ACC2B783_DIPCM|nr:hypothetical protein O6H91_17G043700 [Diphasiastrum complanatum]